MQICPFLTIAASNQVECLDHDCALWVLGPPCGAGIRGGSCAIKEMADHVQKNSGTQEERRNRAMPIKIREEKGK